MKIIGKDIRPKYIASMAVLIAMFSYSYARSGLPAADQTSHWVCPDALPYIPASTNVPPGFEIISKAAETQAIRITAEIKRNCRLNEPINLHLTLENHRNEDVSLDSTQDESDFYVHLVDVNGSPVKLTPKGEGWVASSLYSQTANSGMMLHAGQSISREYDLQKYFEITHKGTYRLTVVKTVSGTHSYPLGRRELEVDIDSIVFNVAEK
jgi:hypothetical protein